MIEFVWYVYPTLMYRRISHCGAVPTTSMAPSTAQKSCCSPITIIGDNNGIGRNYFRSYYASLAMVCFVQWSAMRWESKNGLSYLLSIVRTEIQIGTKTRNRALGLPPKHNTEFLRFKLSYLCELAAMHNSSCTTIINHQITCLHAALIMSKGRQNYHQNKPNFWWGRPPPHARLSHYSSNRMDRKRPLLSSKVGQERKRTKRKAHLHNNIYYNKVQHGQRGGNSPSIHRDPRSSTNY